MLFGLKQVLGSFNFVTEKNVSYQYVFEKCSQYFYAEFYIY